VIKKVLTADMLLKVEEFVAATRFDGEAGLYH
jgi:hypothetical protein